MSFTDNPVMDAERYSAEQERKLMKYPKCCECCEYIQDEFAYHIGDEWFCEDCMKGFREEVTVSD